MMATTHSLSHEARCERLNQLLVQVHRGLLQYADLCWPWADDDESERRELLRHLAARQREGTRELVELLDRRGWAVDYGLFPAEFSDLNNVAVDQLWLRLIRAEQELQTELWKVRQVLVKDEDVVAVIDRCVAIEQEIMNQLQSHVP